MVTRLRLVSLYSFLLNREGGCVGVRETDTMDTFVDSSWYFMRYPDTHNDKEMICNSLAKQWLPVDVYIGGIEHGLFQYAVVFTTEY